MPEVSFNVLSDAVVNATLMVAGPLGAGDNTSVLTINQGDSDVSVQVYGAVGGSTVAVQGSIVDGEFAVIDDTFGVPMSYTALPRLKPVGPALQSLRAVVTGGSDVAVFIAVFIVSKRG